MPRIRLTAKGVESLATAKPQEDFWDTNTPGLCLRVSRPSDRSPGGRRVWYVRYRTPEGKHRRMKLGEFPHLSLAKARDKARSTLSKADAGEDPAQERQARKGGETSFRALAEKVLEARARKGRDGKPTRSKTRNERRRILERDVFPFWGARPAASISRADVVELVEGIADRAPVQANRTLSLVRLVFNDGIRRGFPGLETNPAHLVAPPGPEGSRDRYLRMSELRVVWSSVMEERDLATRAVFRLALLTAQRIGSVSSMRWQDMDRGVWTIPAESFKGKRPHLVPLSSEALAVVREVEAVRDPDSDYLFPSRAGAKRPHIHNVSGALTRIRRRAGIPHWVAHDFRTTFRTWATRARVDGGLGVDPRVADAVLGHKDPTLGFSRYTGDQERYLLHEKGEALTLWGGTVATAVEVGS